MPSAFFGVRPGVVRAPFSWRRYVAVFLLSLLASSLLLHLLADGFDFSAAIGSPRSFDYSEGLVWQQAVRIPGPDMYSRSQALPFIAFQYPPMFYLLVHLMRQFGPGYLAAGRAVSVVSAVLVAGIGGTLVILAARQPGQPVRRDTLLCGLVTALLILSTHVVHVWGMVMRVDAASVALGLCGLLSGALARGRLWALAAGLLLCVAAAYTKQTQVAAGFALFATAFTRDRRSALLAAAVAGGIGLVVFAALQISTGGGFAFNIIDCNVNTWSLHTLLQLVRDERSSAPLLLLALCFVPRLYRAAVRSRSFTCTMLLVYGLASVFPALAAAKTGANVNYFFELVTASCIVAGFGLATLVQDLPQSLPSFNLACMVLVFFGFSAPFVQAGFLLDPVAQQREQRLVARIAAAAKPVSSEDMLMIMQAGKSVYYEPFIVTELALLHRWDERPLIDMIRGRGFAFMITGDDRQTPISRRSAAVDAAMRENYPRVEKIDNQHWINFPKP